MPMKWVRPLTVSSAANLECRLFLILSVSCSGGLGNGQLFAGERQQALYPPVKSVMRQRIWFYAQYAMDAGLD